MIFPSYKKHTTHIVLCILLLAMVGIIWYGVVPLKQNIYEKMQGIQEFYARGENRDKQIARLPELKTQYDAIIANEKLLGILISEDQAVNFVKTLEGLASETNIEMSITSRNNGQVVEPGKKIVSKLSQPASDTSSDTPPDSSSASKQKPIDILNDIPFDRYLYLNIKARGEYKAIVVFLRKMETLPVGLDVIGVQMKEGDVQGTAPIVSGNGVNPFLASGIDTQPLVPVLPVIKKRVFEAVFDVLVYVSK